MFGIVIPLREPFVSTPRRIIVDEAFYHLYNRGNHREPLFHQPCDYERFLWTLTDAAAEHGVGVAAYCLMPNHYHLLVRQQAGGSLERAMRCFEVSYVKYYNGRYAQVGHLFQGRYQLRLITSNADLVGVSRYIHRNPVELAPLGGYEWSSYRSYLGEASRFCDPEPVLEVFESNYHGSYEMYCKDVKTSGVQGYCVTK